MGKNEDISAFRTTAVTNNKDATTITQNLATEGFTPSDVIADAYNPNTSHGSSYNLSPNQLRLVADAIKDPSLLQKPEFVSKFFGGTIESPNAMAQRWQNFLKPSPTPSSKFTRTIESILSETDQRTKRIREELKTAAREVVKKYGRKILQQTGKLITRAVQKIGPTLLKALRTIVPAIGRMIAATGKVIVGMLAKAGAALVASAEVWVPILIICCVLFLILGPILFPGAFSVARSNLTPVNAGTSLGPEDPNYKALICTPDDPECPDSFCKDCDKPVKCGPVTQCPGESYSHGTSNSIDFGMGGCPPTLMGVYSQVSGIVSEVSMNYSDGSGREGSSDGYGNYIKITHTDPQTQREFVFIFGHLSNQNTSGFTPKITVGQEISPTQIIGYADHTGNSSGPHLHYEIRAVDGGKAPSITTLIPGSGCN